MNDNTPLEHYEKTPEGAELRRALLRKGGFPIDNLQHPKWPKSTAGEDDILDACACCWSAWRIANGKQITLPPDPEHDARGLRMEINA
jgi:predicted RNase H-like nuclease